jgi:aminoglycoside phosphotransferase (APT) family kinase protein
VRQLRRLASVSQQQAAAGAPPLPHVDALVRWLGAHVPPQTTALVHGDYKLDNVVFHPELPQLVAVLDWELSTLGDPISDVVNMCSIYEVPYSPPRARRQRKGCSGCWRRRGGGEWR